MIGRAAPRRDSEEELEPIEGKVFTVPFDHPDVRIIIDAMFLDGTLQPIEAHVRPSDLPVTHPAQRERTNSDLTRLLDWFKRSRPHSALKGLSPISAMNNLLRTHT